MSSKLVCGVGFNDRKYPTRANGKPTKEYEVWQATLKRCHCANYQREHPTYIGCSVSENFRSYSYFHEWVQQQIGFGQKGFELDKDLLTKGNRVYSEATCVFIPKRLNTLLLSCKAARGTLPRGVSLHTGKFLAQCKRGFAPAHIGVFKTPEEAFQAYKQVKEAFIKSQAEKWKDQIDVRAYEALMRYEVLPTD
jgi:hypothetical protein